MARWYVVKVQRLSNPETKLIGARTHTWIQKVRILSQEGDTREQPYFNVLKNMIHDDEPVYMYAAWSSVVGWALADRVTNGKHIAEFERNLPRS